MRRTRKRNWDDEYIELNENNKSPKKIKTYSKEKSKYYY